MIYYNPQNKFINSNSFEYMIKNIFIYMKKCSKFITVKMRDTGETRF